MQTFHAKASFCLSAFLFFLLTNGSADTRTWTGLAGDDNWLSSANWNNNIVPGLADDVVLDNSVLAGSYTVNLPDVSVIVKTITITAGSNNTIQLILPFTNTLAPALTITGPGYGLVINNGGVFKNSSGISSGSSLSVADSIKINNGGKYSHNTRASHAASIVQLLSKAPGTENGIFEFDVPGAGGYTISMSNRTYGSLLLSATSATNGIKTYTGSGSNTLTINGDLQIGIGVTFKADLASENGNIDLRGNFIQSGGVVDLASGPDNTILKIKGDVLQSPGGVITESSTGQPAIELDGSTLQNVSLLGTISNNIIFRMNNSAGAVLQASLSLPYKLELLKGAIISSPANLLTLQAGVNIFVDSANDNTSFVNGPLRKEGLSSTDYFLFPVGKSNEFHWLELKNATGNFIVEYFSADARTLGTNYGSGIDHISSHGYWEINADANPVASGKVELSFANASGSGVTDMATLRAAELSSGVWIDRNNTATTGTAGAAGSVVSETISTFNSTANSFVLASSVSNENPLPVILTSFTATRLSNEIKIDWNITSPQSADHFEIWSADDSVVFKKVGTIQIVDTKTGYEFIDRRILKTVRFYKLRIIENNANDFFSEIISVKNDHESSENLFISPSVVYDRATVVVNANERSQLYFIIVNMDGQIIDRKTYWAGRGGNTISYDFSRLAAGIYILSCINANRKTQAVRFIKL